MKDLATREAQREERKAANAEANVIEVEGADGVTVLRPDVTPSGEQIAEENAEKEAELNNLEVVSAAKSPARNKSAKAKEKPTGQVWGDDAR